MSRMAKLSLAAMGISKPFASIVKFNDLVVGVPVQMHQRRVCLPLAPHHVQQLTRMGIRVLIEEHIGEQVGISNRIFHNAGAEIVGHNQMYSQAKCFIALHSPSAQVLEKLTQNTTWIFTPYGRCGIKQIPLLQKKKASVLLMDRAEMGTQGGSFTSSAADLIGYRAILTAAKAYAKPLQGYTTPERVLSRAQVLILGSGRVAMAAARYGSLLGGSVTMADTHESSTKCIQDLNISYITLPASPSSRAKREGGIHRCLIPELINFDIVIIALEGIQEHRLMHLTGGLVTNMRRGSICINTTSRRRLLLSQKRHIPQNFGVRVLTTRTLDDMSDALSHVAGDTILSLFHYFHTKDAQIDFNDPILRSCLLMNSGIKVRSQRHFLKLQFQAPLTEGNRIRKNSGDSSRGIVGAICTKCRREIGFLVFTCLMLLISPLANEFNILTQLLGLLVSISLGSLMYRIRVLFVNL